MQRKVFNVVHKWAKDCVRYDGHDIQPVHVFVSCSKSKGKSYLVKAVNNIISKRLLYHCKDHEKTRVFWTYRDLVNIGVVTISSGLGKKPGTNLLGLNDNSKPVLRNRLLDVKLLLTDVLSMISIYLGRYSGWSLRAIFMMTLEKEFACAINYKLNIIRGRKIEFNN